MGAHLKGLRLLQIGAIWSSFQASKSDADHQQFWSAFGNMAGALSLAHFDEQDTTPSQQRPISQLEFLARSV